MSQNGEHELDCGEIAPIDGDTCDSESWWGSVYEYGFDCDGPSDDHNYEVYRVAKGGNAKGTPMKPPSHYRKNAYTRWRFPAIKESLPNGCGDGDANQDVNRIRKRVISEKCFFDASDLELDYSLNKKYRWQRLLEDTFDHTEVRLNVIEKLEPPFTYRGDRYTSFYQIDSKTNAIVIAQRQPRNGKTTACEHSLTPFYNNNEKLMRKVKKSKRQGKQPQPFDDLYTNSGRLMTEFGNLPADIDPDQIKDATSEVLVELVRAHPSAKLWTLKTQKARRKATGHGRRNRLCRNKRRLFDEDDADEELVHPSPLPEYDDDNQEELLIVAPPERTPMMVDLISCLRPQTSSRSQSHIHRMSEESTDDWVQLTVSDIESDSDVLEEIVDPKRLETEQEMSISTKKRQLKLVVKEEQYLQTGDHLDAKSNIWPYATASSATIRLCGPFQLSINPFELTAASLSREFGERYSEGCLRPRRPTIQLDESVICVFQLPPDDGHSKLWISSDQENYAQYESSIADTLLNCTTVRKIVETVGNCKTATTLLSPKVNVENYELFSVRKRLFGRAITVTKAEPFWHFADRFARLNSTAGHLLDEDDWIKLPCESSPAGICGICCKEYTTFNTQTSLSPCQHSYCFECLTRYCLHRISLRSLPIQCPSFDCYVELSYATLKGILPLQYCNQYKEEIANYTLALNSDKYQLCPRCERVLHVEGQNALGFLFCVCSHQWCINCNENAHWPLNCMQTKRYERKFVQQVSKHTNDTGVAIRQPQLNNRRVCGYFSSNCKVWLYCFNANGIASWLDADDSHAHRWRYATGEDRLSTVAVRLCPWCRYPFQNSANAVVLHCSQECPNCGISAFNDRFRRCHNCKQCRQMGVVAKEIPLQDVLKIQEPVDSRSLSDSLFEKCAELHKLRKRRRQIRQTFRSSACLMDDVKQLIRTFTSTSDEICHVLEYTFVWLATERCYDRNTREIIRLRANQLHADLLLLNCNDINRATAVERIQNVLLRIEGHFRQLMRALPVY